MERLKTAAEGTVPTGARTGISTTNTTTATDGEATEMETETEDGDGSRERWMITTTIRNTRVSCFESISFFFLLLAARPFRGVSQFGDKGMWVTVMHSLRLN